MREGNENEICVCGHDKRSHRRNGKCTRCGCKSYGETPHPNECRCEPCAWNRIMLLEARTIQLKQALDQERERVDKLEQFVANTFNFKPEDLVAMKVRKAKEEERKKAVPEKRKLLGRDEKSVEPKPEAPPTQS